MELTHTFTVPASVEETWSAFMDLEGIAPCFPGATLTSVDGDSFTGSVKIKLGPIAMQYNGTGTFLERDEGAHRAVIEAKGKDKRGNGTAGATVVAQLSPDGTGTSVEVTTDLAITGKPAQFGRGVIQDVSDKLLNRFVECIAAQLQSGPEPAVSGPVVAEPVVAEPAVSEPAAPTSGGSPDAPPARTPPPPPRTESPAVEIDFGATVLPVLLKRYGVPTAVALVLIAVLIRVIRR